MSANCSLSDFRIESRNLVHICDPDCPSEKRALRPSHGTVPAVRTENDWLVIPRLGHFGLPLHSKDGGRSWKDAWEDEAIELYRRLSNGSWKQIEDWEEADAKR